MAQPTKTDEVIAQNLEGFFEKLSQAADVVSKKLVEVAPEAAESLLMLVQAKGIFDLLIAIFIPVILVIVVNRGTKSVAIVDDLHGSEEMMAMIRIVICVVTSALLVIPTAFSLMNLFEFYNWVAALYPEGAVALKALEAAGISL